MWKVDTQESFREKRGKKVPLEGVGSVTSWKEMGNSWGGYFLTKEVRSSKEGGKNSWIVKGLRLRKRGATKLTGGKRGVVVGDSAKRAGWPGRATLVKCGAKRSASINPGTQNWKRVGKKKCKEGDFRRIKVGRAAGCAPLLNIGQKTERVSLLMQGELRGFFPSKKKGGSEEGSGKGHATP